MILKPLSFQLLMNMSQINFKTDTRLFFAFVQSNLHVPEPPSLDASDFWLASQRSPTHPQMCKCKRRIGGCSTLAWPQADLPRQVWFAQHKPIYLHKPFVRTVFAQTQTSLAYMSVSPPLRSSSFDHSDLVLAWVLPPLPLPPRP